jgi:hypothetical protein
MDKIEPIDNIKEDKGPKKMGRPKKIIDYDCETIMIFLRLFVLDAKSWNDCIGKIIKYTDLVDRNIYQTFVEESMEEKLKKTLLVNNIRQLSAYNKISCLNDIILLLKEIAKRKGISIIKNNSSIDARKKYVFGKMD